MQRNNRSRRPADRRLPKPTAPRGPSILDEIFAEIDGQRATRRNIGTNQGFRSDLVDNINEVPDEPQRPTGTSAQAGLRRLEKAADAGDKTEVVQASEVPDAG